MSEQPKVEIIELGQIDASSRLRPVKPKDAAKLALSMQDNDTSPPSRRQINPILVRPKAGGGYLLVAGGHRLEAARILGWQEIEAVVAEMSDDEALEAEVDENLYRKDLTFGELVLFTRQKFELFTYYGGKLRRGRKLGKSAYRAEFPKGSEDAINFYDQIQAKFGIRRRTAEKLLRCAKFIPEQIWNEIKSDFDAYPAALLEKIAALEGETPGSVTEIVAKRECSLREAVRIATALSAEAVENAQKQALEKAWQRASETVRAAFLRKIKGGKS